MAAMRQFYPTLEILEQELESRGVWCERDGADTQTSFREVLPYTGQAELREKCLYFITRETGREFPRDKYSFVTADDITGGAGHIRCPEMEPMALLALLMELFSCFRRWTGQMDRICFSDGDLNQLCELGMELMDNPVLIHDDWFIITAMSSDLPQYMQPDYIAASEKGFIPRYLVEEFKYDNDYMQTYTSRGAHFWDGAKHNGTGLCIYANLWEANTHRGRLLVLEARRKLRSADRLLAECIADRAEWMMQRIMPGDNWQYYSVDSIVQKLLEGENQDPAGVSLLLELMQWNKSDQYLCVRLQNQQSETTAVMGHAMHSDLFQRFRGSYIMFVQQQQCVVMNLTAAGTTPGEVRYRLSPLCRDYYYYAGISSPVWGIENLPQAFRQADIALEQAFFLRNERWVIPFSTCALDVMLRNIQIGLRPMSMVAPELLALREFDHEKGTQYFETLRCFLRYERNIPEAANAMIVHRSTLIYRIRKIQSMLNLDLDNEDQRLYLLLSLKLMEQDEMEHKNDREPERQPQG